MQFVRDGDPFGGSTEKDFEEAAFEDYFPTEGDSTQDDSDDIPF